MPAPLKHIALAALIALLTACGGGGGSSDDSDTQSSTNNNRQNNSQLPSNQDSGSGDSNQDQGSAGNTTVSINWNAPSSREDDSPLTMSELSGYEIYYLLDNSTGGGGVISISDPSITEYTTDSLRPGTYHFAISSIDTDGLYSTLSDYYTITIP